MAPPSVPTHPHNKAPTADRLVAGGGFSLDVAQRENLRAAGYIIITVRQTSKLQKIQPETL